jgi:hypothetical protein
MYTFEIGNVSLSLGKVDSEKLTIEVSAEIAAVLKGLPGGDRTLNNTTVFIEDLTKSGIDILTDVKTVKVPAWFKDNFPNS